MAIRLVIGGENLDLPQNFSFKVDFYSPVFNNMGSQSNAVTVPATAHNLRVLGHPERIDNVRRVETVDGQLCDGAYIRNVRFNILSSSKDGIELSFGTDESLLYSSWNDLKMRDITGLPVYTPEGETLAARVSSLVTYLNGVYKREHDDCDFRVFPVALEFEDRPDDPEIKLNDYGVMQPHDPARKTILNDLVFSYTDGGFIDGVAMHTVLKSDARDMTFGDDDEVVHVPAGYGVSPFLRVGRLLHLLFESFGYTLQDTVFDTDPQLKNMVVLNNCMDAICAGYIDYKDLLPDCTVNDLLESLKARFGAVFFLDGSTHIARCRLLKDIFSQSCDSDLTSIHASVPALSLTKPQRLVLKLDNNYAYTETGDEDLNFREFLARYRSYCDDKSYMGYAGLNFSQSARFFARYNAKHEHYIFFSSLFFDWDTKEKDIETFSLSGKDRSLAVYHDLDGGDSLPGSAIPLYLSGVRNAHTTIKSSSALQSDDTLEENTDLCFCFAHGLWPIDMMDYSDGMRYGSPFCTDKDGDNFVDSEGNEYIYSLYAVGSDGSYNRFFKEFDCFLRGANYTMTFPANVTPGFVENIDVSRKSSVFGQELLPDKISVQFPLNAKSVAECTFRTLRIFEHDPSIESLVDSLVDDITLPRYYWMKTSNIGDKQQALCNRILSGLRRSYAEVSNIRFAYRFSNRSYFTDIELPSEADYESGRTQSKTYAMRVQCSYDFKDHDIMSWISGNSVVSETVNVTETLTARRRSFVIPQL